ncbi:MAG: type I polyketide synthase, partial [Desulfococcaceae bacterium]
MDSNLPISTELIESAIAVVGLSLRFPGADRVETFWQNLLKGAESISAFSDAELTAAGVDPAVFQKPNYVRARGIVSDAHGFDAFFFGFNPKEAEIMDVQHRIFLECAWEALESAGYDPDTYPGLIGVYAGANMSTYFLRHIYPRLSAMGTAAGYQSVISNEKDFLPSLTAYKLNLRGPSVCIQSACSTALVAVHSACQSLLNGECDMALAGGVSVETPQETGYLYEEEMILSPDGHCRPFDAEARGTVGGNGCGIVLLKRLEDALADRDPIRAMIRGTAVNNDGALKVGYTAPGITGQASVIAEALGVARVDPESIGYVEAHGTGTALGDPVEIAALHQAFATDQRGYCALGSVKSNVGHLGPAAGAAGLIKAVLAVEHGRIPPTLHFKTPNPKIDFSAGPFYVNSQVIEWPSGDGPRRAGVSSFGIGGANAHAVLEEAPEIPEPESSAPDRPWQLLVLSAKTESAANLATRNLAARFRAEPSIDLGDAAFTLQTGRRRFGHRRALVCRNIEDAVQVLETPGSNRLLTGKDSFDGSAVVFMFSGQGSQYIHMGRETYHTEPVFRDTVDRCVEILKPLLNMDLREVIYPDPSTEEKAAMELNRTGLTQPALFVLEYALARLWMSWGIHPAAMIGHSIGEYVAACLAGVFSLEGALHLVAERGRLMGSLPAGGMTAVFLSEPETIDILKKEGDSRLSLAAVNSPSLCTVSGPNQEIQELEERLQTSGIAFRRLHTSHAFHSEMMGPILEAFAEKAAGISLHVPNIPWASNLTGDWVRNSEAVSPEYWAKHLRGTVRFADGIRTVSAGSNRILLEIGPGSTLAGFAREILGKNQNMPVFSSLPHPREKISDDRFLLTALGNLWLHGTEVDWNQFHGEARPRRRIPLPTYPFEHQSYCFGSPVDSFDGTAPPNIEEGKNPEIDHWFYIPSWKRTHSVHSAPGKSVKDTALCIILMDESGLGRRISDRLRTDGHPVVAVTRGAAFSQTGEAGFTVNPAMPRDFQALFKALHKDENPSFKILHLWSLTGAIADGDPSPD